jgi:hypothetical protein
MFLHVLVSANERLSGLGASTPSQSINPIPPPGMSCGLPIGFDFEGGSLARFRVSGNLVHNSGIPGRK